VAGKTEATGIKWWFNTCRQYGVPQEHQLELYEAIQEHFQPAVRRSESDVLADFFEKAAQAFRDTDPGQPVPDPKDLMREHGLDPTIRSDLRATRKFMLENQLLSYVPGRSAQYVRRLTNGSGGVNAATAD